MSKPVAIVTGASQGIGQATAVRLSRDFSALVLVAQNTPTSKRPRRRSEALARKTLSSSMSIWPVPRLRRRSSIRPRRPSTASSSAEYRGRSAAN